jgi:hypothetical protein
MKTNVYVFQTSVQSVDEIQQLKGELERVPEIVQWNFDLDDPGFRVFRIVSVKNISNKVISLFEALNFKCVALVDDKNDLL